MARRKKEKLNEIEYLDKVNNLSDKEIEEIREQNQKHKDEISQRKVRNFISGLIKRIVDLIAGIVGTILLIPFTIFVIILRLINHEKGPIIYDQIRIGKNGKPFKIYKYRTMVVGADEILQDYLDSNQEAAEEYQKYKKLEHDPRMTKSGELLRKTSLDEFPQFINILLGQMSLVGPRPYLLTEKEDMGEYYNYIIEVKPGLTGPWQIAGRNNLSFEDRLKLDEEYVSHCGNIRDFKIILKTFKKVIGKEGAV
jgi:undecaprenyl-phosphate galactose phosphotransferase